MTVRLALVAVLFATGVALALPRGATAQTPPLPADTCGRLDHAANTFGGDVAYAFIDLRSGRQCSLHGDTAFATASLYKVFVLVAAYEQQSRGAFSLDEILPILPEFEADDPQDLRAPRPTELPASEALRLMVQVSDNPAAAALRKRLGPDAVAALPVRLGLRATSLGAEFTTTAADVGRLFQLLYEGKVVSPVASRAMLDLLRGEFFKSGLATGLPEGVSFAHKTGDIAGVAHDAGIVFTSSGDYVLVVLTKAAGEGELVTPGTLVSEGDARLAAGLAPRIVFDLQPSYDLMASIASISYQAVTGVEVPSRATAPRRGIAIEINGNAVPSWRTGTIVWVLVIVAAAVLAIVVVREIRRRPAVGRPAPPIGRLALRAAPGGTHGADVYYAREPVQFEPHVPQRRDQPMRFGSRNQPPPEEPRAERVEPRAEDRPRPAMPVRATMAPITSQRLRRVAEYFVAQEELLHEMRRQVEMETAPLAELLVRQQGTMQQTMSNLEERLRPLNEYADAEESNLGALEQRMNTAGMDFVARSFAEYLTMQRERIAETRGQIDDQRAPFLRYDEDARGMVEVALSRFDDDLGALEHNLAEQRRVMLKMLDAMRSEAFVSVKELLLNREQTMEDLARAGITDPSEIATRLHALRGDLPADGSTHLQQVLSATDASDQRLSSIPSPRPHAVAARTAIAPPASMAEPTAEAENATA